MKLIIANWKMNPATLEEAAILARESDVKGLVIAPPFPFLETVRASIKQAMLGAQDVSGKGGTGAYTGEVSGEELQSLGVTYVIVGHSERRALGETDEQIAEKIRAVIDVGLIPVLCVGESWQMRERGEQESFVAKQLQGDLALLREATEAKKLTKLKALIVAYEPLWAIGTGTPETPQGAASMIQYIKRTLLASRGYTLTPVVLYGGSVNAVNAASFLKEKEIDGLLVGGASLDSEEIKKIVEIAKI